MVSGNKMGAFVEALYLYMYASMILSAVLGVIIVNTNKLRLVTSSVMEIFTILRVTVMVVCVALYNPASPDVNRILMLAKVSNLK